MAMLSSVTDTYQTKSLTDFLEEKFGVQISVRAFESEQALAAYARIQSGTDNVIIAPDVYAMMEKDARYRDTMVEKIAEYFNQKVTTAERYLQDRGHLAASMGYVVHPDGSASTWVHSDYQPDEGIDIAPVTMSSETGEESQAMRLARKRAERNEVIKDFSVRQLISSIQVQQAMEAKNFFSGVLFV